MNCVIEWSLTHNELTCFFLHVSSSSHLRTCEIFPSRHSGIREGWAEIVRGVGSRTWLVDVCEIRVTLFIVFHSSLALRVRHAQPYSSPVLGESNGAAILTKGDGFVNIPLWAGTLLFIHPFFISMLELI